MLQERLRNFFTLYSGNILAQLITFGLYPYVARLYNPTDFSNFGFIVSLTTFLTIFSTGQLHSVILNPRSEEEIDSLIGTSTVLVLISVLIVLFITFSFFRNLWTLPFYLLLFSLFEIQKMVLVKRKAYSTSSLMQVSFRAVGNGTKITTFFASIGSLGLVLSEICALICVVAYGVRDRIFNIQFKRSILQKYWRFPVFQTVTISVVLLIADFPILFWKPYFSPSEIGFFAMGQRLLITPALVMSLAVQNSSAHAYLKSQNKLKFYLSLIIITSLFGFLAFSGSYLLGDYIFPIFLGGKWIAGTESFKVLSFLFVIKFGSLITQGTYVLNHEIKSSFILRFIHLVFLFFILKLGLSFLSMLKLYVVLDLVIEILLIIRMCILIKQRENQHDSSR